MGDGRTEDWETNVHDFTVPLDEENQENYSFTYVQLRMNATRRGYQPHTQFGSSVRTSYVGQT